MRLKLPDELPEKGDITLFKDNDVEIIFGNDGYDNYRLSLFLKNHNKYSDIVPNDGDGCDIHPGVNDNYSTISDLPEKYSSKYMKAYNYILSNFDVYRGLNGEPIGVCTACIPENNSCGILSFGVLLDKY